MLPGCAPQVSLSAKLLSLAFDKMNSSQLSPIKNLHWLPLHIVLPL